MDFVEVALGKEWAQWAVSQARRQNGGSSGATLAFEKASRDFAGGVHFFFVVDSQREEVDTLARRLGGHHCGEQHGVTVAHGDGAISLLSEAPSFEGHGATSDFGADAKHFAVCHRINTPYLHHHFTAMVIRCQVLGTGVCRRCTTPYSNP